MLAFPILDNLFRAGPMAQLGDKVGFQASNAGAHVKRSFGQMGMQGPIAGGQQVAAYSRRQVQDSECKGQSTA